MVNVLPPSGLPIGAVDKVAAVTEPLGSNWSDEDQEYCSAGDSESGPWYPDGRGSVLGCSVLRSHRTAG